MSCKLSNAAVHTIQAYGYQHLYNNIIFKSFLLTPLFSVIFIDIKHVNTTFLHYCYIACKPMEKEIIMVFNVLTFVNVTVW